MKLLRYSLISIIGAFSLMLAQASYAQAVGQGETFEAVFDSRELLGQTAFIARSDLDEAIEWAAARGVFVSMPLGEGYELYYASGSEVDIRLRSLTTRERQELIKDELIPRIDPITTNQIIPIDIVYDAQTGRNWQAKKKDSFITLTKKTKLRNTPGRDIIKE